MTEKEYIERESIYSRVKRHTNPYGKPTLDYESGVKVLDMIKQEPTADVVEVVHGEWEEKEGEEHIERIFVCSVCRIFHAWGEAEKYNYCPHCGAKMDGKRKEQQ